MGYFAVGLYRHNSYAIACCGLSSINMSLVDLLTGSGIAIIAIKEQQKIEEEERNFNVMLSAGVMQIGKYTGMTAADVYAIQPSYIEYAASQNVGAKKSHFSINVALCKQFMEENPALFVKEEVKESEHIGDIGEAVNVEMKITTVRIVDGFAYNSKQLYVVGFDKDNNKIALYTTKKEVYSKEEGDTLVLKRSC